jgi:hypothetical protein
MAMGGHRPECQHASMPACQHATTELLACRGAPQQHIQTRILLRLTTDQHTSMPACHLPGCWYVCNARVHPSSTDMPTFFVLLPRWLAIDQHASMPTTGGAGMLGCTLAAQTDQHSWPPFPHWLAIDQHASMTAMPRPRSLHAGVHPSSTDKPAFLAPFLAGWPSTSMPACHDRGAGMLGCTPAAQTDQHSYFSGFLHTSQIDQSKAQASS